MGINYDYAYWYDILEMKSKGKVKENDKKPAQNYLTIVGLCSAIGGDGNSAGHAKAS